DFHVTGVQTCALPIFDLGDAVCTSAGECSGTVRTGRDLVLRAEDAVTGAERWTATVPFRSADAVQCTATYDAAWGGSASRIVLKIGRASCRERGAGAA